jgi:DNA-binding CsgD family transcriptional regulator
MKDYLKGRHITPHRLREVFAANNDFFNNLPGWIFASHIFKKGENWLIRFIFFNETALNDLGYEMKEIDILGTRFFRRIIHPCDIDKIFQSVQSHNQQEPEHPLPVRFRPKNQHNYLLVFIRSQALKSEAPVRGTIFYHTAILVDNDATSAGRAAELITQMRQMSQPREKPRLTNRKMEILALLDKGYSRKEIAEKLFISEDAVKSHICQIYHKLNVHKLPEAIHYMRKNGFL